MKISKEKYEHLDDGDMQSQCPMCVRGHQQEEFLRPQPDTLSDLTAMSRANQHVHISMNAHQNIIKIP